MMNTLVQRIEKHLYDRGFTLPGVRVVVRNQCVLLLASLCLLPLSLWAGVWPFSFVAGTALATYNFYSLAKFIQEVLYRKYTRALLVNLLVRVYGRLFLTGLVLFVLIYWLKASVVCLLLGLSTVVATICVWGGTQLIAQHNVKEA